MTIKECPLCLTFYPRYTRSCFNGPCILDNGGKRAVLVEVKKVKRRYESMKEALFYVFLSAENPLSLSRRNLCMSIQWRFEQAGYGSKELFECLAKLIIYGWVETIDGVTFSLSPYGFEIGKALITKKFKFSKLVKIKTEAEKKKLIFAVNDVSMKISEEDIYGLVGVEKRVDGKDIDDLIAEKDAIKEMEKLQEEFEVDG